jgi:hypothetical protein
MSISRLLETDRGKILLVNTFDMAEEGLLEHERLRLAIKGLKAALRALSPARVYGEEELVQAIAQKVYPNSQRLHANGTERPAGTIHIAAVRTFPEIATLLLRVQKNHPDDIAIRRVLRPRASDEAIADAARLINRYCDRLPQLEVGGLRNFFWATSLDRLRDVEQEFFDMLRNGVVGLSPEELPNYVRDMLGLAHISPDPYGQPCHLFVFEGQMTLDEMAARVDFRCARPTTIDGFENPRFRQRRPPSAALALGFGMTVNLGRGVYGDGLPELVSTGISIAGHFKCRHLGKVSRMPLGSDVDFVDFLQGGRDLSLMIDKVMSIA